MSSLVNVLGSVNDWIDGLKSSIDAVLQKKISVLYEGDSEKYPQLAKDYRRQNGYDENRLQRFVHLLLHLKVPVTDEYGFLRAMEVIDEELGYREGYTPVNPIKLEDVKPVKDIRSGALPEATSIRVGKFEARSVGGWNDYSTNSTLMAARSILIYF